MLYISYCAHFLQVLGTKGLTAGGPNIGVICPRPQNESSRIRRHITDGEKRATSCVSLGR